MRLKYQNGGRTGDPPKSNRDAIPQYSSMEEMMAMSPYDRGGSGSVQNVFGPADYTLGAFPLMRALSPAAKSVGKYLGLGRKASSKIPYKPIDITDAKNISDFPTDIPGKELGSEYEFLINEIMDDYNWDNLFHMKELFNKSSKDLAADKKIYSAVMKRVEDFYTPNKGGQDVVSALLNVKNSGQTLSKINKIRTEAIEEVADEFRKDPLSFGGSEIDFDRFIQQSANRVHNKVKDYAASQIKNSASETAEIEVARRMNEAVNPFYSNAIGGRIKVLKK